MKKKNSQWKRQFVENIAAWYTAFERRESIEIMLKITQYYNAMLVSIRDYI